MRVKYPTPGSLPNPVKPFASINIQDDDKKNITVTAQVLLDRLIDDDGKEIEGAEFGLALDGSASMKDLYGGKGVFNTIPNRVEPVAKAMLKFLAGYAGDGSVEFAYWAVGAGGKEIESVGRIADKDVDALNVIPCMTIGRGTYLTPIVKHFTEDKLKDAPWAMAVIVTDGLIDDMEDVLKYTEQYAVEVDAGKRKLIKLVLIGLGEHVDVGQLEALDDYDASVDVDVWSSKLATEMEELFEVFDEVMSENFEIAPSGRVVDNNGEVLASFNDGLPAKIQFTLKTNSTSFTLEVPGQSPITQDVSEALKLF